MMTEAEIELLAEKIAAKLQKAEKKTYTLAEAATALSMSTRTVRRYMEAGLISRIPGTAKPIIPASEIEKLLKYDRTA